ncbi:Z1 domain-containing protein [Azospirillum agricola]|uniref:Z1 domain-containing protein n=1 Tax=Azospirillum agricola TaxID=1720247 RepID=UPI000A0EF5CB|nr:Z1 domain-containing protein [Azospirillum agricola]SMH62753.1 replication restart DNA helicase PriA [Azospirillum lipoferum]
MTSLFDLAKFKDKAKLKDRYAKQLQRLQSDDIQTDCIETAVNGAVKNLTTAKTSALVIYGEPQSGKTEMMICLTAKLLDQGHKIIVHLLNDSVDLLSQNLRRFKASGLAPAPRTSTELLQTADDQMPQELIVFCKKNGRDLEKLIDRIKGLGKAVVIDDEADYATPNTKINQGAKTPINDLVGKLIGEDGFYIGVTATPARLDLNNTFQNDTEKWVNFPPHAKYTGQDIFFPLDKKVSYRLTYLQQGGNPQEARDALVRFLVTVAYLNEVVNEREKNYTMLVHTSGKKLDHEADRVTIEEAVHALTESDSQEFATLAARVYATSQKLYPAADPDVLTGYVVTSASRASLVVLNSERDRKAAGDNATEPSSPFTIIIGGNIVSRGVTFPNLLSMFFTRNVQHKLQQDTYIQRARMFGARGAYLEHFELTIPTQLYADWHRCFVFHRLALATIKDQLGSPVWIGDSRVAVASDPSIDKATVALDKGEMSFGIFNYMPDLDEIVLSNQTSAATLDELRKKIGNDALPGFLIDYIRAVMAGGGGTLAVHTASSIATYGDSANQATISRDKGFMGKSQLEPKKFPTAVHHIKVFYNSEGKAKLFYKYKGSLQFIQNLGATLTT